MLSRNDPMISLLLIMVEKGERRTVDQMVQGSNQVYSKVKYSTGERGAFPGVD